MHNYDVPSEYDRFSAEPPSSVGHKHYLVNYLCTWLWLTLLFVHHLSQKQWKTKVFHAQNQHLWAINDL